MALLVVGLVWLVLVWWTWRRERLRAGHPALHRDLLAGGLLFLLTLGFFWRTLRGDVYQPADGGDLVSFLFPTYRFAARQLSEGVLPLWNPYLYGGAPFIADIQAGFLYPPNLLLFLFWPDFPYPTLQWIAIGHLYWAGLGMYVLLRTLRWGALGPEIQPVSRPAAIFAALAFQFSDPLLIHLGNLNLIAVLSWLPWVIAAFHRALVDRSLRWAGLAGLLFALANYAGHAQSSLYIGLAITLYAVVSASTAFMPQNNNSQFTIHNSQFKSLGYLLLTLLITTLLSAPILLPALELTNYTERSQFSYQEAVNFSLAPTQAIGLITPGFFGHGPALHWSLWERVETPFAGVTTLILAVAGLVLSDGATRRRLWPWLVIALFGLVVALGVYAILHGWLTLMLPIFGQLRAPARALVLWTFAISVLAAVGFDQIRLVTAKRWGNPHADTDISEISQSTPTTAQWNALDFVLKSGALVLAVVMTPLLYLSLLLTQADPTAFLRASVAVLAVTLATGVWLATWALIAARRAGWIGGEAFATLLIALLYFDLSAAGAYTDISPADPTSGFQQDEIVQFLKSDPARFRIDTNTGIEDLWQPDAAALHELEDIGGVANPLALRHWRDLLAATGGRQSRLYDMLNVKYVLVRDGTPLPEGKFELVLDAAGELSVYRNVDALPRAWLVHEAMAGSDSPSGFDPAQQVSLQIDRSALDQVTPATGEETVEPLPSSVNRLQFQVQSTTPGYLVMSEVWYPGWRATVNGVAREVLPANQALRAVYVPAGDATVEMWFAPPAWRWGLIGFAPGLLLLAIVGLWSPLGRSQYTM
jgi:hypothetical protein